MTAGPPSQPPRRFPFALFRAGPDGMPPWVPRLLVQIAILVAVFLLGLAIVRQLQSLLVLIGISFFLSTAFEPAVGYLAKRGWRRGAATGVLFFLVFVLGGSFLGMMIPLAVDQTLALVDRVPSYMATIEEQAARINIDLSAERLTQALTSVEGNLEGFATDIAGRVFGVGSRLLGTVFQGLTIGLFTFYITADGPRWRRAVLSVLRPPNQRELLRILDIAVEKTGGYFYSRSLLAAVAALATWIVLTVLDMPFALPLGIWVGVLSQFVPVIGTYLGGLLPLLIALLESPVKALAVLAFIVVYQQVENYLIGPRLTAHTMALHPAVAFGAVLIGGSLLGAAGALMALPVAATFQAFISTYLERHDVASLSWDQPPPPETTPA